MLLHTYAQLRYFRQSLSRYYHPLAELTPVGSSRYYHSLAELTPGGSARYYHSLAELTPGCDLFRHDVSHQPLCTSPDSTIACWKCGSDIGAIKERFFCHCGLVQPPNYDLNYFQLFGFEEEFNIDISVLSTAFKDLQWLLHPDKFASKSKEEQDFSYQQSRYINKAYQCISKPVSRAMYILELNGLSLEEGDVVVDADFLMHILEQNEILADADTPEQVNTVGQGNHDTLLQVREKLSQAFHNKDYAQAKEHLARLKYYVNIDEKVKEWIHNHQSNYWGDYPVKQDE